MTVECLVCHRPAWTDIMERGGKDPTRVYRYRRFGHRKRYGRNPVHYIPLKEGGSESELVRVLQSASSPRVEVGRPEQSP